MNRTRIVASLRDVAMQVGAVAGGSEWYLFGSADRNDASASDIDVMILCNDASHADALRQAIDPDSLVLPLHLSFLTYTEAMEVDAIRLQHASKVYP